MENTVKKSIIATLINIFFLVLHVAIISEVGKDYIVIAQQNSSSPFAKIGLKEENGNWHIQYNCIGFLRIPDEI